MSGRTFVIPASSEAGMDGHRGGRTNEQRTQRLMEAWIHEPGANNNFDPQTLVANCIEGGFDLLLLDESTLPPAFFDLRSGMVGDLLHRLSVYRLRMAAVVPDLTAHNERFQEFAREANRGTSWRFFDTREAALEWLQGGPPEAKPR